MSHDVKVCLGLAVFATALFGLAYAIVGPLDERSQDRIRQLETERTDRP